MYQIKSRPFIPTDGGVPKVSNCVKSGRRYDVFFGGGNEDMAEHEGKTGTGVDCVRLCHEPC